MKKVLLFTVTLALAAAQAKADIASTVMLHHKGKTTLFAWDKTQDAVNAAVDGDTIYLSNGQFSPFNINKRIMVRGAGYDTIVLGGCIIAIDGTQELKMPVLDAITFNGDVKVTGAYKQCTIRKCQMTDLVFYQSEFRDVKIEQCYVTRTLHLLPNCVKEFNAFNSSIHTLRPYDYLSGHANFYNCNILEVTDSITATFNNCVLKYVKSRKDKTNDYGTCFIACRLNYCIFGCGSVYNVTEVGGNTTSNIITIFDRSSVRSNCSFESIKDENIAFYYNKDYLDGNGQYIGIYGDLGWTRYPALPRVTKHSMSVDAANRKLNVTLTVSK